MAEHPSTPTGPWARISSVLLPPAVNPQELRTKMEDVSGIVDGVLSIIMQDLRAVRTFILGASEMSLSCLWHLQNLPIVRHLWHAMRSVGLCTVRLGGMALATCSGAAHAAMDEFATELHLHDLFTQVLHLSWPQPLHRYTHTNTNLHAQTHTHAHYTFSCIEEERIFTVVSMHLFDVYVCI